MSMFRLMAMGLVASVLLGCSGEKLLPTPYMFAILAGPAAAATAPGVSVVVKDAERRVDITIDGKPFTSYLWQAGQRKPILYPLLAPDGTTLTRGNPPLPASARIIPTTPGSGSTTPTSTTSTTGITPTPSSLRPVPDTAPSTTTASSLPRVAPPPANSSPNPPGTPPPTFHPLEATSRRPSSTRPRATSSRS